MKADLIHLVFLGVSLIGFIFYAIKLNAVIALLKTEHRMIWLELGSPTLITGNSPKSMTMLVKFVMSPPLKIEDAELLLKCRIARRYFNVVGCIFFITMTCPLWVGFILKNWF